MPKEQIVINMNYSILNARKFPLIQNTQTKMEEYIAYAHQENEIRN